MIRLFCNFVRFGLLISLAAPVVLAQKPAPPPPTPNPSSGSGGTSRSTGSTLPTNSNSINTPEDYVMYLSGEVATDDGSALPTNVMVERVCNSNIRQQVYADPEGGFSMQLGGVADSTLDASAEGTSQSAGPTQFTETGIPRNMLANCDLRASAAGFESPTISLVGLDDNAKALQVGTIRVHRREKVAGTTLNAAAYRGVPKDAITAYDKGLDAALKGKLASAQKEFEKAVEIHPVYKHAWFELGTVRERQKDRDGARTAYKRATDLDERFLPPHLALASMAFEDHNWKDVLSFTGPILAVDPFTNMTGYTMELEPFNYAETYYYNAVANFALNQFAEAEKSALKAQHLLARSPDLHLLLSNIYAHNKNYDSAVSELQTYLQLVPDAKNADQVRARVTELEQENKGTAPAPETKPN